MHNEIIDKLNKHIDDKSKVCYMAAAVESGRDPHATREVKTMTAEADLPKLALVAPGAPVREEAA
jgi:hypothetical protein